MEVFVGPLDSFAGGSGWMKVQRKSPLGMQLQIVGCIGHLDRGIAHRCVVTLIRIVDMPPRRQAAGGEALVVASRNTRSGNFAKQRRGRKHPCVGNEQLFMGIDIKPSSFDAF